MKRETNQLFAALKEADWTAHVGIAASTAKCISVGEAISMAASDQCGDIYMHEADLLANEVYRCSQERFQQWNSIITDARRQEIIALVDQKLPASGPLGEVPDEAKAGIQWLIAYALIESEFADVHDRRFFRDAVEWLIRGHLICGWSGEWWPKGKPVIH